VTCPTALIALLLPVLLGSPDPRVVHTGNGKRATFAYPIQVADADDLRVTQISTAGGATVLTRGTQYDVTGVNKPNGAKIVLANALPVGGVLVIDRRTHRGQPNGIVGWDRAAVGASSAEVESIVDRGATPDDLTDDTAAIQAAITAACSSGKRVYVPPGTYLLTPNATPYVAILQMSCGLELFGAGVGESVLRIKDAGENYWSILGGATTAGVPSTADLSDTFLHDLTFDHNASHNPSKRSPFRKPASTFDDFGITFIAYGSSSRVRFEHTQVVGGHGVWVYVVNSSGTGVWMQHNSIEDWGSDPGLVGTHTGRDDQRITLTDSSADWEVDGLAGATLMNLTDHSYGVITSNTATTITTQGFSGGTDNDFDAGDAYSINIDSSGTYFHLTGGGIWVLDNSFAASITAPFSRTAIETHGSTQHVSGNRISGYQYGMNITGISTTDSTGLVVSANTLDDVQTGVLLWSAKYPGVHESGYGIDGATVDGNTVRLVDHWARPSQAQGPQCGICVAQTTSSLPVRNLVISDNEIYHPIETTLIRVVTSGSMGIGWYDQTPRIVLENARISGNVVSGVPQNGVRLSVALRNVKVSDNLLINTGNSLDTSTPIASRTPLFVHPPAKSAMTGTAIENNEFVDTLKTTRIGQFVYLGNSPLNTPAGNRLTGNRYRVTGTTRTVFVAPVYHDTR
jgi:hypothetical protein